MPPHLSPLPKGERIRMHSYEKDGCKIELLSIDFKIINLNEVAEPPFCHSIGVRLGDSYECASRTLRDEHTHLNLDLRATHNPAAVRR
jgi:hypothetical protein